MILYKIKLFIPFQGDIIFYKYLRHKSNISTFEKISNSFNTLIL